MWCVCAGCCKGPYAPHLMGLACSYQEGLDLIQQQHHCSHLDDQQDAAHQVESCTSTHKVGFSGHDNSSQDCSPDACSLEDDPIPSQGASCHSFCSTVTTATKLDPCDKGVSVVNSKLDKPWPPTREQAATQSCQAGCRASSCCYAWNSESSTAAAAAAADARVCTAQLPIHDAPLVIMWLGSSIGNNNRQEAEEFLRQVKNKAMRPGEWCCCLLLSCVFILCI